jgi:hypothetical protein
MSNFFIFYFIFKFFFASRILNVDSTPNFSEGIPIKRGMGRISLKMVGQIISGI